MTYSMYSSSEIMKKGILWTLDVKYH
jgi:hypothetical protein